MSVAEDVGGVAVSDPSTTLLIDTDVHEAPESLQVLAPYLAPEWRRILVDGGFVWQPRKGGGIEHLPYVTPQGGGRRDWHKPTGGSYADDVQETRRILFEDEGVTHAILCGSVRPGCMRTDYEFAAALAGAYNDWQIEHWLSHDDRLFGSVHIVADLPDLAAREIDRVGDHPQIAQVFLPTVHDRQYGDPRYRPIFEAAARHGLPVAFHHGADTQLLIGYPRYYVEWHTLCAPHAAQAQLADLIFNGLFDAYPELKVVLLETGVGWLPWFMNRADQQYREMRANCPWVKRLPSEHMRDGVRVSTQPITEVNARQFTKLVEMWGIEEMYMFATDYPHYDADSLSVLDGVPDDLARRIRYRNALAFYPRLAHLAA